MAKVQQQATPVGTRPGDARSPDDARQLDSFEARIRIPLILSAVLPLIFSPNSGRALAVAIGVLSWLVFVVDYVVNVRRRVHYRKTAFGRFDLIVVIVTAPWFLLPSAQAGSFVVLLRLARLARLVMASRGARRLLERLGRVAIVSFGVVLVASLVAYYAEHPTNPGFATIGDAFWWGIVTLTTVGYGDIVPHTPTGRWAGVVIMFTGVAVLGVLAGSLASFFRLDPTPSADAPKDADAASAEAAADEPSETDGQLLRSLVTEVTALRAQVEQLSVRLSSSSPDPPSTP